jgi:hypothetical protein
MLDASDMPDNRFACQKMIEQWQLVLQMHPERKEEAEAKIADLKNVMPMLSKEGPALAPEA